MRKSLSIAGALVVLLTLVLLGRPAGVAAANVGTAEGDAGSYTVQVQFDGPFAPGSVTPYSTSDGTATVADNDYVPFLPGNQAMVCPGAGDPCSAMFVNVTSTAIQTLNQTRPSP